MTRRCGTFDGALPASGQMLLLTFSASDLLHSFRPFPIDLI